VCDRTSGPFSERSRGGSGLRHSRESPCGRAGTAPTRPRVGLRLAPADAGARTSTRGSRPGDVVGMGWPPEMRRGSTPQRARGSRPNQPAERVAAAGWLAEGRFPGCLVSRPVLPLLLRFNDPEADSRLVQAFGRRFSSGSRCPPPPMPCGALFT
jgi:hypothetical protein